jgi:hypothetical protein
VIVAKRKGRGKLTDAETSQPSEYGGKPRKGLQIGGSAGNALHDMYTSDPGKPPRGRR